MRKRYLITVLMDVNGKETSHSHVFVLNRRGKMNPNFAIGICNDLKQEFADKGYKPAGVSITNVVEL